MLEERTGGEFRVLVRADLERARELAPRFACPAAWHECVMLLEGRRVNGNKGGEETIRFAGVSPRSFGRISLEGCCVSDAMHLLCRK